MSRVMLLFFVHSPENAMGTKMRLNVGFNTPSAPTISVDGATVVNGHEECAVRLFEHRQFGVFYTAVGICGPWEAIQKIDLSTARLEHVESSGKSNTGLQTMQVQRAALFWGMVDKAGNGNWVFSSWASDSPAPYPVPPADLPAVEAGGFPTWILAGMSGPTANLTGPLIYSFGRGMAPPKELSAQAAPVRGFDVTTSAPLFRPSASARMFDNSAYVPPVAVPSAPSLVPGVTPSEDGVTRADLASLEARLIKTQESLHLALTALAKLPTATELRDHMIMVSSQNQVINGSVGAVGDAVIDGRESAQQVVVRSVATSFAGSIAARLLTR